MFKSIKNTVRIFACIQQSRKKSTQAVNIAINNAGIATITMQEKPVNALSLNLLQSLQKSLEYVESEGVRGIILTSGNKNVFSAGLDFKEFYKPSDERVIHYITQVKDVFLKFYMIGVPTAAAINGHAIAGGCLLSLCCEYRVMVNNSYKIGVNEVQIGLAVPVWAQEIYRKATTKRNAEVDLVAGSIHNTNEAIIKGIIDEIANDDVDAYNKCLSYFERFESVNMAARTLTKRKMNESIKKCFMQNHIQDIEEFCKNVQQPAVQKHLEAFMK